MQNGDEALLRISQARRDQLVKMLIHVTVKPHGIYDQFMLTCTF